MTHNVVTVLIHTVDSNKFKYSLRQCSSDKCQLQAIRGFRACKIIADGSFESTSTRNALGKMGTPLNVASRNEQVSEIVW